MKMAQYLGKPASALLRSEPFEHWPATRNVDDESDPPETRYVFEGFGLEFICDRYDEEMISTLFLTMEMSAGTVLSEIPFDSCRDEVLKRFGFPSKSGEKYVDPIIGKIGPWDRFQRATFVIHFQYEFNIDRIHMITLMRNDVVP